MLRRKDGRGVRRQVVKQVGGAAIRPQVTLPRGDRLQLFQQRAIRRGGARKDVERARARGRWKRQHSRADQPADIVIVVGQESHRRVAVVDRGDEHVPPAQVALVERAGGGGQVAVVFVIGLRLRPPDGEIIPPGGRPLTGEEEQSEGQRGDRGAQPAQAGQTERGDDPQGGKVEQQGQHADGTQAVRHLFAPQDVGDQQQRQPEQHRDGDGAICGAWATNGPVQRR